jgi:carboxyl-terminal processing protease
MQKIYRLAIALVLFVALSPVTSSSQTLPERTDRLAYLAKVWGYVKYFHPGAAGCESNMDTVLLESIRMLDTASSYATFEGALLALFEKAGPVVVATKPAVDTSTLFKSHLDLEWQKSAALPASIRSKLDSVRINFRPHANCYFLRGSSETSYLIDENSYPTPVASTQPHALLLLFRAWNIHNYFSPYKQLLTPSWDSALVRLIPYFSSVSSTLDLHLAFARYQSMQADAHSVTGSNLLSNHFGSKYLPALLKLVEGKTVVTKVFEGVEDLRVGDVILKIDGTPVQTIRDSLRPYVQGGAKEIVDRNTSTYLLRGTNTNCTLELENTDGIRTITLSRSSNSAEVADSASHPRGDGEVWKLLPGNVGYVNVGKLTVNEVGNMFSDLSETAAIVFEMRNYPGEFVIYDVADQLLPSSRQFCNFYFPDPEYPGTFENTKLYCGPSPSNPDYYKGEVRILQNERTQSQAEFTIMAWQTHPKAKIIGSQTAGADGNVTTFQYPTALSLTYTGCGVLYPDMRQTQIVGIEEDVTVTQTINGIRAGRDELLEAALASIPQGSVELKADTDFRASLDLNGRLSLLNCDVEQATLKLYDVAGREVHSQPCSSRTIDISHLMEGSYLLELISPSQILRTRILKGFTAGM